MNQHCRGYTLIEMLVAMSLISVALMAVVLTLHALYGVERRFRSGMAAESSLDRLTLALREDVHFAQEAKLGTENAGRAMSLILSLPSSRTVTYTFQPNGIERLAAANDKKSRELYRVDASSAVWEINAERTPARVALRLPPADKAGSTGNLRREIGVVATVGLIRPPAMAAEPSGEGQENTEPSAGESP